LAPPPVSVAGKPDGVSRPPAEASPLSSEAPPDDHAVGDASAFDLAGGPGDSSVTVAFSVPRQAGARDDGFGDDFGTARRATVLAGPLAPPEQPNRRLIRYDLLAGAALVLALLALVPLLLLRGDPEEMSSTPQVPAAGGADSAGEVTVELAEPTDLTDEVQLSWKATRELDFAVVVAAEGEKTRVLLAERNHSITVDVEPGLKYCFMIQASDGDRVYESEPQPLRGATCQK
jgi:hypothetical protein